MAKFKFKRFSSVTRNVSVKHPILNLNLFQKPAKIEKCPPKFFSWVVWTKTNWSYTFLKWISWQISSNWLFQRNMDSDLEKAQTSEPWYMCFSILYIWFDWNKIFKTQNSNHHSSVLSPHSPVLSPQSSVLIL